MLKIYGGLPKGTTSNLFGWHLKDKISFINEENIFL